MREEPPEPRAGLAVVIIALLALIAILAGVVAYAVADDSAHPSSQRVRVHHDAPAR